MTVYSLDILLHTFLFADCRKKRTAMNTVLLNIAFVCLLSFYAVISTSAQKTITCKSENAHISLSYPSSYRKIPIVNAPHMILHLKSEKGEDYTFSCWEYGLDESYDVWDQDIFQEIERNASKASGVKLISCKRVMLTMKNQKRRAAETIHSKANDYIVTYQTLWKGNLMQIVYVNQGSYTTQSPKGQEIINSIQLQ